MLDRRSGLGIDGTVAGGREFPMALPGSLRSIE
jgi:hypothetical protein